MGFSSVLALLDNRSPDGRGAAADRRLGLGHMVNRVCQLLVVARPNLGHAILAVKAGTDGLIGLHELVKLSGEFLILNSDDTNVVVERIDLDLQVRVVVEESRVTVSGAFKLFSHVHDLVFLGANLRFKVFDAGR